MAKLTMLQPSVPMMTSKLPMLQQTRNPDAIKRTRGRAWMTTRAKWFRNHPLCAECERKGFARPASILDHITPLIDGGADDESNYQSLCPSCHDDKTAQEARARG